MEPSWRDGGGVGLWSGRIGTLVSTCRAVEIGLTVIVSGYFKKNYLSLLGIGASGSRGWGT